MSEPPREAAKPFALQMVGDWAKAAKAWQGLACPYEVARALAESADEDALREALATFEGLGAHPAAAAVAKQLRDMGARGIPRGPRPSTRANPAKLTAREVEILALVGEGLSNRAIARKLHLATKTVGHHVSSILAKLEVRTRTEAVRAAIRHDILVQSRDGGQPN